MEPTYGVSSTAAGNTDGTRRRSRRVRPHTRDKIRNHLLEHEQHVGVRARWLPQIYSLLAKQCDHAIRVKVEEVGEELVGILCLDAFRQISEVTDVRSHDDLGTGLHC